MLVLFTFGPLHESVKCDVLLSALVHRNSNSNSNMKVHFMFNIVLCISHVIGSSVLEILLVDKTLVLIYINLTCCAIRYVVSLTFQFMRTYGIFMNIPIA